MKEYRYRTPDLMFNPRKISDTPRMPRMTPEEANKYLVDRAVFELQNDRALLAEECVFDYLKRRGASKRFNDLFNHKKFSEVFRDPVIFEKIVLPLPTLTIQSLVESFDQMGFEFRSRILPIQGIMADRLGTIVGVYAQSVNKSQMDRNKTGA